MFIVENLEIENRYKEENDSHTLSLHLEIIPSIFRCVYFYTHFVQKWDHTDI